jgi:hypothetical protein
MFVGHLFIKRCDTIRMLITHIKIKTEQQYSAVMFYSLVYLPWFGAKHKFVSSSRTRQTFVHLLLFSYPVH